MKFSIQRKIIHGKVSLFRFPIGFPSKTHVTDPRHLIKVYFISKQNSEIPRTANGFKQNNAPWSSAVNRLPNSKRRAFDRQSSYGFHGEIKGCRTPHRKDGTFATTRMQINY